mmetsp:Transcript_79162/g.245511  ORF Transcript_79162/g.245511 Transcript_79162/m.245511 type:complete len:185 (-) Transcript_79162:31-585(-)
MEAQGPEGHRACWDVFVFNGVMNYQRCCILKDNRHWAPENLGGRSLLDVPALRCVVARSLVKRREELSKLLRHLTELTYQSIAGHMDFVFAAPKWPEDAARPKYSPDGADPPFLPALYRYPREICEHVLREALPEQTSCAGLEGWTPHFGAACPPFILLHARVIAGGLDSPDPSAFFRERAGWI